MVNKGPDENPRYGKVTCEAIDHFIKEIYTQFFIRLMHEAWNAEALQTTDRFKHSSTEWIFTSRILIEHNANSLVTPLPTDDLPKNAKLFVRLVLKISIPCKVEKIVRGLFSMYTLYFAA